MGGTVQGVGEAEGVVSRAFQVLCVKREQDTIWEKLNQSECVGGKETQQQSLKHE